MKAGHLAILTEGGSGIGLGHVNRCLAIADAWTSFGGSVDFFLHGIENAARPWKGTGDRFGAWFAAEQRPALAEFIENSDAVLVDSYLAEPAVFEWLASRVSLLISLDDAEQPGARAELTVNGALDAEKTNPKREEGFLLGSFYTPLRREFHATRVPVVREKTKNILITMGGDDGFAMSGRIAEFMSREFPEVRLTVVIGPSFRPMEFKESTQILRTPSANEMRNAMQSADLVITAGGQTLYELAALGKPAVTVQTAANQTANILAFARLGAILPAGEWNSSNLLKDIHSAVMKWEPRAQRESAAEKARSAVDGRGAIRIAKAISETLDLRGSNFRPALASDETRLLSWRNDPITVSSSITQAVISMDEHRLWLRKVTASGQVHLWMYRRERKAVGWVRFELQGASAEMSWAIAPEKRGRGIGREMVAEACRIFAARGVRVHARTFESNLASRKIAKAAGFKMVGENQGLTEWKLDL